MKIERVVLALGVSRSSVHFIENYKIDPLLATEEDKELVSEDQENALSIDYKALRLLHEC